MTDPTLTDLHLRTFFADSNVSLRTHQLIKKLPAFISSDLNDKCHFHIIPSVQVLPSLQSRTAIIHDTFVYARYRSRSQKMLQTAKKANLTKEYHQRMCVMKCTERTRTALQRQNALIRTFTEYEITRIIRQHKMIDPRCDAVLSNRSRYLTATHRRELSLFLTDTHGMYRVDKGHHTQLILNGALI